MLTDILEPLFLVVHEKNIQVPSGHCYHCVFRLPLHFFKPFIMFLSCFRVGFKPQVVFARICMFPVDIMLTELAKQHIAPDA